MKSVRIALLQLSALLILAVLAGCPTPGGAGPGGGGATTGSITGHARFSGQANSNGILVSAESMDTGGKTLAVRQELASRSLSVSRSLAGQVTTDTSGAYTISGLAAGTYTLYASSQNSLEKAVTTGITVVAGRDVIAADLSLTPTGAISGTATLGGAATGNLGILVFIAGTSYAAMTDNNGAYTISSVPASTGYTLVSSMSGYNSSTASVDVAAGQTTSASQMNLTAIVVRLSTGFVTGTVQLNGAASGNTGVFVYLDGTPYITMTTSSSGAFSISGVAPGSYTLVASMIGYSSASVAAVSVVAGSTTNAGTLNLPPSPSTTGTVTGTARLNGQATGNAGILVSLSGTSYTAATTDAGAFSISGVPAGSYTVVASMAGYSSASVAAVSVVAGSTTSAGTLNLPPSPSTTGTVTGTARLNGQATGNAGILVSLSGTSYTAATTDTGAFSISGVPAGSYTVVASMAGYSSASVAAVSVVAGSTTNAGTLNLPPSPSTTGTVTGTARLNGQATGNAGILVSLSGTSYTAATTDTGAFSISGVPAGSYTVVASMAGYSSASVAAVSVVAGSTTNAGTLSLSSKTGGVVITLAGSAGSSGSTDGVGTAARFNQPGGIVTDGSNLYVADSSNNTIRKVVISTGAVTTLAGTAGSAGSTDGAGSTARFNNPYGIATDGSNLYVADTFNHTIRKVVISTGAVTTLAGTAGSAGSTDGVGSAARFMNPAGIATDGSNLYVADISDYTIRKVLISTGAVTTLAGTSGYNGSTDGVGSAARFFQPAGIATDGSNLYVADSSNHTIRKVVISTAAVTTLAGSAGSAGSADGVGSAARFYQLFGIATDGSNLYVADRYNDTIRKVVIAIGAVTTLAGSAGSAGSTDGVGSAARFNYPDGIATDGSYLYVADSSNNTIREVR